MTELKPVSNQKRGGGVPSRDALYRRIAGHANDCIDYLVGIMNGTVTANPVRMGAAKILLNKVIPDIKVTELQGNMDKPLGVVLLPTKDYEQYNMEKPSGAAVPGTPEN